MPTSTAGIGTPAIPRAPPNAMTTGKVTGSSHRAGGPSCAPHSPTATMASTWSSPEIGWSQPREKPTGDVLPRVRERGGRPQETEENAKHDGRQAHGAPRPHRPHGRVARAGSTAAPPGRSTAIVYRLRRRW